VSGIFHTARNMASAGSTQAGRARGTDRRGRKLKGLLNNITCKFFLKIPGTLNEQWQTSYLML